MAATVVLALLTRPVAAQSTVSSAPVTASTGDVSHTADGAAALFNRPGLYVYVPKPGQAPIIEAAVNRGVAHMVPIVRSLARQRLMATNALPDTLRLFVGRDTISTQLRRDKPMSLPRSGSTVVWDDGRGNICRASAIVAADTLVQSCNVGTAASIARYVLLDDNRLLWMIVHITSPRLTLPVDYSVAFRRLE